MNTTSNWNSKKMVVAVVVAAALLRRLLSCPPTPSHGLARRLCRRQAYGVPRRGLANATMGEISTDIVV